MKFGYFDDAREEYVITTPTTPLPWINYLGNKDFFSIISNTMGGYSFYKDAKLLRITRYRYNDVPYDSNGKYFYIQDGDTLWNPAWQPTRTRLDSYECRHGLGYSRFRGSKNGIEASVLAFVPLNDTCEVEQVKLTNRTKETKEIKLYSYVEWCLWNASDDCENFQRNLSTGEVEIVGSTIFHKTEYRERRNHYAIRGVNCSIDGFDTIRSEFIGMYNGADRPQAILDGGCKNSVCSGWSPIAAQQINISLVPGETKSFDFVLGYIENPDSTFRGTVVQYPTVMGKMGMEFAIKAVNGETLFDAGDRSAQSDGEIRKRRLHFGLVFQSFNLFPQYTALKNVMLAKELLAREQPDFKRRRKEILNEIEHQARQLLIQMGLADRMSNYPHQLSGGQQQRVAIARALALEPDILCFDEPTSALDPELTGEVLRVIRELAEKKTTMIIVTHEMAFARDVASHVIFMDNGYIVEQGDPVQVIEHPKEERTRQFLAHYAQK